MGGNFLENKTVTFVGTSPIEVTSIFINSRLNASLSFNETLMERVGATSRKFTINGTFQFGNSSPIAWDMIDRCTYHLDNSTPTLPDYTLYTLVPLKVYFLIFIAIHLLQSFSIFILKSKIANAFSKFNYLEKMIHCHESTNLPYNVQEWDTPMGDAQDHIKRMKANRMEGLLLIALNLIFKFIMLIPIFVLGYNMKQRHQALTTSIGAHPDEQEAEAIELSKIVHANQENIRLEEAGLLCPSGS